MPRPLIGAALGVMAAAAIVLGLAMTYQHFGEARQESPQAFTAIDIGFLQHMSVHHDQAVLMSQIGLMRGEGELRAIAMSMLTAQLEEIGRMRGWLRLWDKPELPGSNSMNWMIVGDDVAAIQYAEACGRGGMPGMASSQELNQLRALGGADLKTYFLQLMLRHHQGGIPMARVAARHAENAAVRELARRMLLSQGEESARMNYLLANAGAEPLPTPVGAAPLPEVPDG